MDNSVEMKKILQMLNNTPAEKTVIVEDSTNVAVQHHQTDKKTSNKNSQFKKYIKLAEDHINKCQEEKRKKTNTHARLIVERIQAKQPNSVNLVKDNIDTVTLGVPLLIRLLEYAREDAKTDMDLHAVADQLIKLSKQQDVLSMSDYDSIVSSSVKQEQ